MHSRTVAGVLALSALLLLQCVSVPGATIEQMAQSAESASDHRRIAEYDRRAAGEARAEAAEHERLAEVYGGRHRWGMAFAARASEHCNQLTASSLERADQYDLLAAQHEGVANE